LAPVQIRVPTLVLVGGLDLPAVHDAARRVTDGIAGARHVDWPDTAHLPSMERPDDFHALLRDSLRLGA
jgi:pimeloyl-ACP methyl ester carboxylesterase